MQAVIADVVAALDAFADLGLAESMYQLAGANLERAAAATDMIGRASAPPDVFESTATPRGGRGIEQRVVVTFGSGARPAGYASDTPRARLAPAADAFVARRLGALDGIRVRLWTVGRPDRRADAVIARTVGTRSRGARSLRQKT